MSAAEPFIRTVIGDVDPSTLGRVDYHEHLFQSSRMLPGEELVDREASAAEASRMKIAGIDAMVEATPIGLGRDPLGVREIAHQTGLKVVHTTGAHHQGHYGDDHWLRAESVNELATRFRREIEQGISGDDSSSYLADASATDVKAGLIKAGAGLWRISHFERRALDAAAQAAIETGASVMVHIEWGSAVFEILDLLGAVGLTSNRVALAHMDRNPDPNLHAEVTATGAYIGYDGMARFQYYPESALLECIAKALDRGADASRFLMGADVARKSRFRSHGGMPGLEYFPARFLPRARKELGDDFMDKALVSNPATYLTFSS